MKGNICEAHEINIHQSVNREKGYQLSPVHMTTKLTSSNHLQMKQVEKFPNPPPYS